MMQHSLGCREILVTCDFPEDQYRRIEETLCRFMPRQVISAVAKADKGADHDDFEYFEPMFIHYIPQVTESCPITFDDFFWEAYDYIGQFLGEDFYYKDMVMIQEMSDNMERLRIAVSKSKQNIKYVFKVYTSMSANESVSMRSEDLGEMIPEIGNKGVKTNGLT